MPTATKDPNHLRFEAQRTLERAQKIQDDLSAGMADSKAAAAVEEINSLIEKAEGLRAEAVRIEKLSTMIDEGHQPIRSRVAPDELESAFPAGDRVAAKKLLRPQRRAYAELFGAPRAASGFPSFGEFLRAVAAGVTHPALRAAHVEGVGASGGFMVAEQHAAELLDTSIESEIIRPLADVRPMKSDVLKISGWDDSDHSGKSPYGGLGMQWLGELKTATVVTGKARLVELRAHRAAIFSSSSNELLRDAPSFELELGTALANSLGWGLDDAFLNGDGSAKPLGVLKDPALITATKESGQAADTLVPENIVRMWSRLHPASVAKAVWVAHPSTVPQLFLLTKIIKNVAATENVGGAPWFMPSGSGAAPSTLLGRPILYTEKLPPIGDKGDLLLADFSQYVIGMHAAMGLERSEHVGWKENETHFRLQIRVDGHGKWAAPFTPKSGSTLSWCVVLEDRA